MPYLVVIRLPTRVVEPGWFGGNTAMETASSEELAARCDEIVAAIKGLRVVPFLGAGINMCGRMPPKFVLGETLPSGYELAEHLAKKFGYPAGSNLDLARVAQFAYSKKSGPLYDALAE